MGQSGKDIIVRVYEELNQLVYFLAHKYKNDQVVELHFDDIVGHLNLKMVEVVGRYSGEKCYEDIVKLVKMSLYNEVKTLMSRHYGTHRSEGIGDVHFVMGYMSEATSEKNKDEVYAETILDRQVEVEKEAILSDIITRFRDNLSGVDGQVFDVLYNSITAPTDSFIKAIDIIASRRRHNGNSHYQIPRELVISRVLGCEPCEVRSSVSRIKRSLIMELGG